MFLCLAVLVEGLTLGALQNFVEDDDWIENLTEWHVASAIAFYPFLTWLLWRRSGWTVEFATKPHSGALVSGWVAGTVQRSLRLPRVAPARPFH